MTSEQEIAQVMRRVFRLQRAQAAAGKVRFGDQIRTVADALEEPVARAYLRGLKATRAGKDKAVLMELAEKAAVAARERALSSAHSICDTNREWLEADRDLDYVFSADRAVSIGLTEASNAKNAATAMAAHVRKRRLRWVTDGKGKCKDCMSLAGRVVSPGKQFRAKSGTTVFAPPLHPNCLCKVEEVS